MIVPTCVVDGTISRSILSTEIKLNPTLLSSIECIVHPIVAQEREIFYNTACSQGHLMAIYDIPLLFEKEKLDKKILETFVEKNEEVIVNRRNILSVTYQMVDYVVVATADAITQKERVMQRGTMDMDTFNMILNKQVDDKYKRGLCDYKVYTDIGAGYTCAKAQVAHIVEDILSKNKDTYKQWLYREKRNDTAITTGVNDTPSTTSATDTDTDTTIDTIIFDLDDTLIDCTSLLAEVHAKFMQHVELSMPLTHVNLMPRLKEEFDRIKFMHSNSEYQWSMHDYYVLRKLALTNIAVKHGEEGGVDEAMEVCTYTVCLYEYIYVYISCVLFVYIFYQYIYIYIYI